ncbi:MAG: MSCRAMM family protein, partial [Mycobacterium sp.]
DIPCPTVVLGSIPPNKSDLTRFYVAHEFGSNSHLMLYLAWERANVLGNANMDFEFNQNRTTDSVCANNVTPTRKAGDMLVTFDFGGSGSPTIARLFWLTAANGNTAGQCYSSNSLPCWGTRQDLTAAGEANGLVNSSTLSDPLSFSGSSTGPVSLPAGTFGEAGIDLTEALSGLTGSGSSSACHSYGSADLNSRSSTSFTSEIKDFIAPEALDVSTCSTVDVLKTDVSTSSPLSDAVFTLTNTDTSTVQGTCTTDSTGHCATAITSVPFGNYQMCETTPPNGYNGSACQTFTVDATSPATITLDFSDQHQFEAVDLNKVDDLGNPLADAVFTIYTNAAGAPGSATAYTCTSQNDGTCDIESIDLTPGNYWLVETTTPTGYGTAPSVEISLAYGATTTTDVGSNALTFTNPRLFKIITLVCNEATGGLVQGTVSYDSGTSSNSLTTLPSGDTGSSICTAAGGGVAPDVHAGT